MEGRARTGAKVEAEAGCYESQHASQEHAGCHVKVEC